MICANQAPDHSTIARFRSRHQDALADLFTEVLRLCSRAGLIQIGTIAFDGTRMTADAASRQNKTYRQLGKEILEKAEAVDAAEDAEFGEARGDELPPELATRKGRIERLRGDQAPARSRAPGQARRDGSLEAGLRRLHRRTGLTRNGRPTKPRPMRNSLHGKRSLGDPYATPLRSSA